MVNSKNHIVMIRRDQLHPHPDNPRKDLGDLEELRESIKEHGIMQNLYPELRGELYLKRMEKQTEFRKKFSEVS